VFAVVGGSTGGWAFLPVAVVVAAVAWWRISATGTRYARGSATAATTFVVVVVAVAVVVGSVAWSSWSSGHASVSAPTASSQSASGLKRVVVGDLA
jgi:branched-subunit amino acid ABC-type transport system permease component